MYLNLVIWERLFDRNTRTGKRINETEISRSRWRGLDKIRKIGWNTASIEPLIPAYSKRGRAIAQHSPMVGAAHRAIAPTQPRWKEWKRGCKCGPRLRIARCNAIPDCVCCESLVALSTPRFSYVNLFHHCLSIGPISHECRIAARISPRVRVKINPPLPFLFVFSPSFIGIEGTSDERASAPNFSNFIWQRVTFCFASPEKWIFLRIHVYVKHFTRYTSNTMGKYLGFANFANERSRECSSFLRASVFFFTPQQRQSKSTSTMVFLLFFF